MRAAFWAIALCLGASGAMAETLRLATYHTELSRAGPGVLLRDILRGEDPQVLALIEVITQTAPDILMLQGVDHDARGHALSAFTEALAAEGLAYPHHLALAPNTGIPTGVDIDGDGRSDGRRDAQSYAPFRGEGGMALLSRYPILASEVIEHSAFLWRDLPGSDAPRVLSAEALAVQRLASVAMWEVPIDLPGGPLTLFTLHANTPAFDGPEDRNGHRNADELRFFQLRLDGWQPGGLPPLRAPLALIGVLNVDPVDGEARRAGLLSLLADPRLQDPAPESDGARVQGDATDTVSWPAPGPGNLRVDYILPSADLVVAGSGVVWPETGGAALEASRHRLVWVDLEWR